jgi:hypothetical protein
VLPCYPATITSLQFKFFLTSKLELPIRLGFEDISGRYEGLALYQIPELVVKEDISAFLEHELVMIRGNYNNSITLSRQLPADWPGQTNVQILVQMAIPLFIFAATVCRFINDRRCGQLKDQLTKVPKYETESQASKLKATYLLVLNQLLVGVTDSEKRGIVEEFQEVVSSIVILTRPLSATSLDRLLGLPEGTAESRTDLLHSVLRSHLALIALYDYCICRFVTSSTRVASSEKWGPASRQLHHCSRSVRG